MKKDYLWTHRIRLQIRMVFREGKEQEISVHEGMVPEAGWSFSECTDEKEHQWGRRYPGDQPEQVREHSQEMLTHNNLMIMATR